MIKVGSEAPDGKGVWCYSLVHLRREWSIQFVKLPIKDSNIPCRFDGTYFRSPNFLL